MAHEAIRRFGLNKPVRNDPPMSKKISPMSRMKCWLKGPVVVTPGTALYQPSGDASIASPLARAAMPIAIATPRQNNLAITSPPQRETRHGPLAEEHFPATSRES